MYIELFFIAVIILWILKLIFKGTRTTTSIRKEWDQTPFPEQKSAPHRKQPKPYKPKTESTQLIDMPVATSRLLTYEDERRAATARQRLWLQYKDKSGNITERIVHIYHPEKDELLFTWCCLKQEPRTFARRNILSWRLLPERFDFDPIVDRYWDEEGTLDMSEKLPWRRWLQEQPKHIADRYR